MNGRNRPQLRRRLNELETKAAARSGRAVPAMETADLVERLGGRGGFHAALGTERTDDQFRAVVDEMIDNGHFRGVCVAAGSIDRWLAARPR